MEHKCDLCIYKCETFEEIRAKEYLDGIAGRFARLTERNKKLIARSTSDGEMKRGKMEVLEEVYAFLCSVCPRDFSEREEKKIREELPQKVLGFLSDIKEKNQLSSDAYRNGMSPALKMAGGYVAFILFEKKFEAPRLSSKPLFYRCRIVDSFSNALNISPIFGLNNRA